MKLKIGVMFGGESVEHEISIITAAQAMAAIDHEKYDVYPIYISKERLFYSSNSLFDMSIYKNLKSLVKKVPQVTFYRKNNDVFMGDLKRGIFGNKSIRLDVILPIMHGTNGEDGTLQGYLETLKIPYGGCDVISSAIGQDKAIMKHILENSNIPVCRWFWFYTHDFYEQKEMYLQQANRIGYPLIIKPACLGSSVGINTAHNDEEFLLAIKDSAMYDRKIVVEEKIQNLKEINASVLGNSTKQLVSVLEEVAKSEEILSYKDKYQGGSKSGASKGMATASRIIPAQISDDTTEFIKKQACATFKALGSSGVCRIDFMMDEDTGKVYVNEINSTPGSLAFYLWEKSGVNFTELMDTLIKLAIDRKREQEKMIYTYDSNVLEKFSLKGAKGTEGNKF